MKGLVMAITATCLVLGLVAQNKHAFIALQTGPSFPLGKYKLKELPDGSFTQTGISASIEGAWFFRPWTGIGGQAGTHRHPVDVGALGYEKMKEDPFMTNLYIRSDPFRNYTFYAGMYFEKIVIQRLSITGKALGGLIYTETPYQLYKAEYYMIGKNWFEITSAGDFEASFLAGAGLKYDLKNCIGFALNGEFTWNQSDFDFLTSGNQIRTDQKIITFLNLSGGIIIKINHAIKP